MTVACISLSRPNIFHSMYKILQKCRSIPILFLQNVKKFLPKLASESELLLSGSHDLVTLISLFSQYVLQENKIEGNIH